MGNMNMCFSFGLDWVMMVNKKQMMHLRDENDATTRKKNVRRTFMLPSKFR